MKIALSPQVAINLEAAVAQTSNEISGVGFCEIIGERITIYDAVILNEGNYVLTQIEPAKIIALRQRSDAAYGRVWWHRHPLGNGIPGPHNWSQTDEQTIRETPLGGVPELMQWSVSIVRTPRGWVGRIDNHIKKTTKHLEVVGQASEEFLKFGSGRAPVARRQSVMSMAEDIIDWSTEAIEVLEDYGEAWRPTKNMLDLLTDIGSSAEKIVAEASDDEGEL